MKMITFVVHSVLFSHHPFTVSLPLLSTLLILLHFPSYIIVTTCPDLGNTTENGNVSYTRDPTEQGRYVENTAITVSCDEGYRSSGDITCQNDGNWSSASLPNCTSKPDIILLCCHSDLSYKVDNSSLILLVGCKWQM